MRRASCQVEYTVNKDLTWSQLPKLPALTVTVIHMSINGKNGIRLDETELDKTVVAAMTPRASVTVDASIPKKSQIRPGTAVDGVETDAMPVDHIKRRVMDPNMECVDLSRTKPMYARRRAL